MKLNANEETKTLFKFNVSGYYFAGNERKYFNNDVFATDEFTASEMVIGKYAWYESINGNSLKIDCMHYEAI